MRLCRPFPVEAARATGLGSRFGRGSVQTAAVGGAIGEQAGGTLTNDYWDEGTSGQSHATGLGASSTGLTAIGDATGPDPHAQATYAGFNFTTTWTVNPGTSRPFLLNPAPKTPPN